jgi:hypothetical protein
MVEKDHKSLVFKVIPYGSEGIANIALLLFRIGV